MSKTDRFDLTKGSILYKLLALALPIMGTSLVQMAYNLTDMFWLGRLGSVAVAASGTVGNYMWLSMAMQHFGSKGAEIGVSQSYGRGDLPSARSYGQSSITLSLWLGLLFGAFLFFFRHPLIGFFGITQPEVVQSAVTYLAIISFGIPFTYVGAAVTGCFSGSGNSTTPFYINAAALVLNMALDPILIFPAGLGVAGAGIATLVAQIVSCLALLVALTRYRHPVFESFRPFGKPAAARLRHIFRWATPIAIESFIFTFLIMVIARFVAAFGTPAMSAQRICSQIESLSWLISMGFGSAFTAYAGQNYGAGKWKRIHRGFGISAGVLSVWGLIITALLFFCARPLVAIFIPNEPDVIDIGATYLRILSACQLIASLEYLASGAFRGLGKTLPGSVISISMNGLRVVAAWLLAGAAGLNGIWWALSLGAAARGGAIFIAFLVYARRLPREDAPQPPGEMAAPASIGETS